METPALERLRSARPALVPRRAKTYALYGLGITLVVLMGVGVWLVLALAPGFAKASQLDHELDFVSNGRKIGEAAQAYFKATGKTVAQVGFDSTTGELSGDLSPGVKLFWRDMTIGDLPIEKGNPRAFFLTDPSIFDGRPIYFSDEGKTTFEPQAR